MLNTRRAGFAVAQAGLSILFIHKNNRDIYTFVWGAINPEQGKHKRLYD